MSNYTKTVDFAAKDTLPSGDSGKIIKGTEFETEFDNISTAIATKADSAAPTFTGTSVFTNLDINGTVQADGAVTVGVDDTGYDVKFFGATAGKSLLWDESADSLIVTGTTTLVGTTNLDAVDVDGDMTFGDNNKAIFGAGSDLQIYHDGSNSIIYEGGTGDLQLRGNGGSTTIMNGGGTETLANFGNNGAVTLYYDNAVKIATTATGIDVTGIVTADGLTVDGNARIEEIGAIAKLTLERGGSANAADSAAVDLLETNAGSEGANFGDAATNGFRLKLDGSANDFLIQSGASGTVNTRFGIDRDSGDISFYNDAAAQGLFWDSSASRLGLGTTTPASALELSGAATANARLTLSQTTAGLSSQIQQGSTGLAISAVGSQPILLDTNGVEAMTIDASGSVGIGTSSPTQLLNLESATSPAILITDTTNTTSLLLRSQNNTSTVGTSSNHPLVFETNATEVMRLDAVGNAIFTKSGGAYLQLKDASGVRGAINVGTSDGLVFTTGASFTEAMRIDASENLLVGKIADNNAVAGVALSGDGIVKVTRTDWSLLLNRIGSTSGSLALFQYDGGTVGSISVTASATAYNTSSDQRLKENIADADDAGSKIDAIQVRKFDWKVDGSHQDYGMVAQELLEVAPESVSAPEDPEEMMGVDYSKLVPMMLKEIQSLRARVAQLES